MFNLSHILFGVCSNLFEYSITLLYKHSELDYCGLILLVPSMKTEYYL